MLKALAYWLAGTLTADRMLMPLGLPVNRNSVAVFYELLLTLQLDEEITEVLGKFLIHEPIER